MNTGRKILIVEDDLNLGFLLLEFLEPEGFEIKLCRDGASGLAQFKKEKFDLCILDVMMPKLNGFQLAEKIRALNPKMPFLFLTARSLKEDKLRAYEIGAEDYLIKPFDEEVLLCKIKVILRRAVPEVLETLPTKFEIGEYLFDYSRQELSFRDHTQRITEKENEVLRLLCLNKNQILKREDAVEKIYGRCDYFLGRSFDVFISRIRKLLKEDPDVSIENVFKVGFILNA